MSRCIAWGALLVAAALAAGCRGGARREPGRPSSPADSYDLAETPSPLPGQLFTFDIRTARDVRVTVGVDVDREATILVSREVHNEPERIRLSFLLSDRVDRAAKAVLAMSGRPVPETRILYEASAWLQPGGGQASMKTLYVPLTFGARPDPARHPLVVTRSANGQEFGRKRLLARWTAADFDGEVELKGSGFGLRWHARESGEPLAEDQVHEIQLFVVVDPL
ncbi:MAG: hypothetical protein ACE5JG_00455 [Planctomycetota bacterium]